MTLNVCEVSNDTNGITTKKYDESLYVLYFYTHAGKRNEWYSLPLTICLIIHVMP